MGFDLAVLVYRTGEFVDLAHAVAVPTPDEILKSFYPRTKHVDVGASNLGMVGIPPRQEIHVGVFNGGIAIVTRDAHLYNPSKLDERYLKVELGHDLVLLTQASVNDMFAYARWTRGRLARSISVNPVGRVWESIGAPEPWERPFWAGDRPGPRDYPLPFHPLDMSDAALRSELHLWFEGQTTAGLADASAVTLRRFQRARGRTAALVAPG